LRRETGFAANLVTSISFEMTERDKSGRRSRWQLAASEGILELHGWCYPLVPSKFLNKYQKGHLQTRVHNVYCSLCFTNLST
jgi:hypothetical protein